jgi:hypothetical protein
MIQKLEIADTAIGMLTVPAQAQKALITVEGAIRFSYTHDPVSATTGHVAPSGSQIELDNRTEMVNFKAYAVGAATLQVTYK